MMEITPDVIDAINERFTWDDIFECETFEGVGTLTDVIRAACQELPRRINRNPTLITVPWTEAMALVKESMDAFNASEDGSHDGIYCLAFRMRKETVDLYTRGFVGTLDSIPVVASVYTQGILVTAASEPKKIENEDRRRLGSKANSLRVAWAPF